MNSFKISPIVFSDIPEIIISEGESQRLIFPKKDSVQYFGGFLNGKIICITCLVINKNKTGQIKSNYTIKKYRKKGYFSKLNKYCLDYARKRGIKRILLNCLRDSVYIHLKAGARIRKVTKYIFWMVYEDF